MQTYRGMLRIVNSLDDLPYRREVTQSLREAFYEVKSYVHGLLEEMENNPEQYMPERIRKEIFDFIMSESSAISERFSELRGDDLIRIRQGIREAMKIGSEYALALAPLIRRDHNNATRSDNKLTKKLEEKLAFVILIFILLNLNSPQNIFVN